MSEQEDERGTIVETEETTDLDIIRDALLGGTLTVEANPEAIAQEIVRAILEDPDVDHALSERAVFHARESVGRRFLARGARWFPSKVASGPTVFAAVDVVDRDSGEVGVLTTSAYKQLAKLFVIQRAKAFPRKLTVVETGPTAAGFYVLDWRDDEGEEEA